MELVVENAEEIALGSGYGIIMHYLQRAAQKLLLLLHQEYCVLLETWGGEIDSVGWNNIL